LYLISFFLFQRETLFESGRVTFKIFRSFRYLSFICHGI